MSILVIGQNTAQSSTTGQPFVGTKSGQKLKSWFYKAALGTYHLDNVSNNKTNNKRLSRSEMTRIAKSKEFYYRIKEYEKVVAVGRQAQLALEIAKAHHSLPNIKVLWIPHPSGLNRVWNRSGKEEEVIEMIKTFVNGGITV
jgi:uracil-DNA glycosylase